MLIVASLVQANPTVAFVQWQAAHGKSYKSTREAERRRGIFAANAGAGGKPGPHTCCRCC